MRRTTSAIAALAIIAARTGLPVEAQILVDDADLLEQRCEVYRQIEDRATLLAELEALLELRPDDPCIDLIVGQLGGASVAEILQDPY
jgi:hypothetical protein